MPVRRVKVYQARLARLDRPDPRVHLARLVHKEALVKPDLLDRRPIFQAPLEVLVHKDLQVLKAPRQTFLVHPVHQDLMVPQVLQGLLDQRVLKEESARKVDEVPKGLLDQYVP